MKKTRIENIEIYTILATLLIPIFWMALFIGICYGIINPILRSKEFNSKDWIENIDSRYRLVNDLKKNKLLEEKAREEIIIYLTTDFPNEKSVAA